MKVKILFLTALMLMVTSISPAQGRPESVEMLSLRVTNAFKAKTFGTLDPGKPYVGRVKFVVEHSLTDKSESKSFSSMKLAGDWLFRGRKDVGVNVGNLQRCDNGTCSFTVNGMLHNNLYIKKMTYGYDSKGRPYVKAVHFVDGN